MRVPIEPLALSFANTRTSPDRDRIDTMRAWRAWVDHWPSLKQAGRAVDEGGLRQLGITRDHSQRLLRSYALGVVDQRAAKDMLLRAVSEPAPQFRWRHGAMRLFAATGTAADMLGTYLARGCVDILALGTDLRVCEGEGCLRTFVATRSAKRWCDPTVCGNRARVRAHYARHLAP